MLRLCRAEFYKMRHSFLFWLHLLVPVLGSGVFLLYYKAGSWSGQAQIFGFFEAVGIVFPFVANVVCSGSVELEEAGHFQTFLGMAKRKAEALWAKWLVLLFLGLFASAGTVFLFAAGFRFLLHKEGLPAGAYGMAALILWAGSVPVYLEHLFLNLRFSRAVSMGVGVAQFLVSALFLTGLGDGRWQFFPCSYSARGVGLYLLAYWEQAASGAGVERRLLSRNAAPFGAFSTVCLLLALLLCAIIMVWFHFYEGRQHDD